MYAIDFPDELIEDYIYEQTQIEKKNQKNMLKEKTKQNIQYKLQNIEKLPNIKNIIEEQSEILKIILSCGGRIETIDEFDSEIFDLEYEYIMRRLDRLYNECVTRITNKVQTEVHKTQHLKRFMFQLFFKYYNDLCANNNINIKFRKIFMDNRMKICQVINELNID